MATPAPLPRKPESEPAVLQQKEKRRFQTANDPDGEDGDRKNVNVDRLKKKKRR